jgi:hypothetical protein
VAVGVGEQAEFAGCCRIGGQGRGVIMVVSTGILKQ